MGITTYPSVTASNISPAAAIPPAGLRRSSSTWMPGFGEPLATKLGVSSVSPRYSTWASTAAGLNVGQAYYTPSNGWRPGYRDLVSSQAVGDLAGITGTGGLLFGSMRGREGMTEFSTASFMGGSLVPIPIAAHQYLPVMQAVDWTITCRMRFPTAINTSGSASTAANAETTPQIRIPIGERSGSDYLQLWLNSYTLGSVYRYGTWAISSPGTIGGSSNFIGTSGGAQTYFSPNTYADWTFAFSRSTSTCTITMTPNAVDGTNSIAGSAVVTSNNGPTDLSAFFGGFNTNGNPYPTMYIDNFTITTGLSDY